MHNKGQCAQFRYGILLPALEIEHFRSVQEDDVCVLCESENEIQEEDSSCLKNDFVCPPVWMFYCVLKACVGWASVVMRNANRK